jgi:general secretion pathway protein K
MQQPTHSHRQAGIALLVVLMLASVIIPFAAEFAYQISLESRAAYNVTDQLAIDNAIESQYQVVIARLKYDGQGNQTDTYEDSWNDDDVRSRSDEDTGVTLSTTVFDEAGKLPIQMLADAPADKKPIWKARFVELIKRFRRDTKHDASSYADEIVDAISRWVTGQANRGSVPKPSTISGRPMLVLDELTFASPLFAKLRLLEDVRDGDDVAPGLQRYVTIYGEGKINLNTAPRVVLQAMFNKDPDIADRIIERREGTGTEDEVKVDDPQNSGSGNPFTDPNQLMEVDGITQPLLIQNKVVPSDDFTVSSNFFSMRIAAQREQSRREELFVVERVPGKDPNGPIDGFRHLLCQERTDPLEELPDALR